MTTFQLNPSKQQPYLQCLQNMQRPPNCIIQTMYCQYSQLYSFDTQSLKLNMRCLSYSPQFRSLDPKSFIHGAQILAMLFIRSE